MTKVSEALYEAVEEFLEIAPAMTGHIESRENPHGVTKAQVGLSNVVNEAQATKSEFLNHAVDFENPHGVTKSQVGLSNVTNIAQATKPEFTAHTAGQSAKHAAKDIEFTPGSGTSVKDRIDGHTSGQGMRHTADDVDFAAGKTVRQKINELIVEGGGGTMNHDELQNRTAPGQHPIGAISGLERFIAPEVIEFTGSTTSNAETELFADTLPPRVDANGRVSFTPGDACAYRLNMTGVVLNSDGYIGYCECFEIRGTFFYLGQVAVPSLVTGTESAHNNAVGEGHLFKVNVAMEGAAKDGIRVLVTGDSSKGKVLWHGTLTLTNLHNFCNE